MGSTSEASLLVPLLKNLQQPLVNSCCCTSASTKLKMQLRTDDMEPSCSCTDTPERHVIEGVRVAGTGRLTQTDR